MSGTFLTTPEYYKNRWWEQLPVSEDPLYTNTEYGMSYYVLDDNHVVHNRLESVYLRDTISNWVSKLNAVTTTLDRYNYLQVDQEFDPQQKPWKLVTQQLSIAGAFGINTHEPDRIIQYIGNGQWDDLGMIDTDPIELFRVGDWQRKDSFGVVDLRAIAPEIQSWYPTMTDAEIYEF